MLKKSGWTNKLKNFAIGAGKFVLWAPLMALAIAIVTLSVYLSWNAAHIWFGANTNHVELISAGIAGIDIVKALLVVVIVALWSMRHRLLAATLAVVLLGTTLASIQATYSVFAICRSAVVGEEMAQKPQLTELKERRAALEEELSALPKVRPVAMITADLKAYHVDRRWTSTAGCTDATATKSRTVCKQYHTVEAELAGANRAEILRGRIEKLNTTILDRTTWKTVSDTAVDLGAIERLTGWTRQGVIEALALALIIELMSIILIAAAWRIRPWDHRLAPANPSVVETNKEEAGTVPAAPQEASKDVTDAPKSKPKKRTKKAAAGGHQTPSRGPSPKTVRPPSKVQTKVDWRRPPP